jgi:WD40 repeat protein
MSVLPALIFACSAAASGAEQGVVPERSVVADTPGQSVKIQVVWESLAPVGVRRPAMAVAFSPDGKDLAASVGEEFIVWRSQDGSGRRVIREPATALAASVAFSPDGTVLASGRAKPLDRTGRLWRTSDGHLLKEYKADKLDVTTVAFSPSDGILATSGYGNGIRLWNWINASPLRTIGSDVQVRFALAFSPDGRAVAAPTARPNRVHVWRVRDGESLLKLEGHTDFVNDVAYSPDGQLLASSSADGTIQIHRASDGERLRMLGDHSRPGDRSRSVEAIAFSADGRFLIGGGIDLGSGPSVRPAGAVRVWQVDGGGLLGIHRVEGSSKITDVAVTPGGELFAYSRDDGVVVVARVVRDDSSTVR